MHIGIHASNTRSAGGQFQFLLMFLEGLKAYGNTGSEISLLFFSDEQKLGERYQDCGWRMVYMPELFGYKNISPEDSLKIRREVLPRLPEVLRTRLNIEFLFFPTWTEHCDKWGLPFTFIVHDLQHRLQPEFPEVSLGKDGGSSWQWRENFFSAAFAAAQFAIVDSVTGGEHVKRFYPVTDERIEILPPTIPVASAEAREAPRADLLSRVKQKFFFYPAQFWPHKNHYRVVEALGLLKRDHRIECDLVLTGGSFGEWPIRENCELLAHQMGIANQVHFLGYVTDSEISLLYKKALALVMPTFFGPANIPYVEAFAAGCAVVGSDIEGIPEQIGDAGLIVDPRSSTDIAAAMKKLSSDTALVAKLRERGAKRYLDFAPDKFAARLGSILGRVRR